MAKAKTTVNVPEISRNIDGFVYYMRNGKTYIRKYSKTPYANTPGQQAVREAFTRIIAIWKKNRGLLRATWELFGKKKDLTGYTAFIGANANLQRNGKPLVLFKEMGIEEEPENFAAASGGAGEIVCSFDGAANGHHLSVFAQRKENGIAEGKIKRFDAGAGISSFTVKGLVPGEEYFVYGVFTDAPYAEASLASGSVGTLALAGAEGARARSK